MQPLGTKKVTQFLGTLKITQPLAIKKQQPSNLLGQTNHATSCDKKTHAFSQDKKIMQPFLTEKISTSRDKKITQRLRSKKSRNLFGQKKITQPLKIKNTLSIGPIASKLVHKALSCSKWHQTCPKRSK